MKLNILVYILFTFMDIFMLGLKKRANIYEKGKKHLVLSPLVKRKRLMRILIFRLN